MIAYNITWLDNAAAQKEISHAFDQKLFTAEEKRTGIELYPAPFYTPNFFIKCGLFLLTLLIASCSFGLFCLMTLGIIEKTISMIFLLFGGAAYATLEYFTRTKHHFRSGVDDALMWASGGCFIVGVIAMMNWNISMAGASFLILIFSVYFALRFIDMFMAGIAVLATLSVVFFSGLQFGAVAKMIMPFVLMAISAVIYLFAKKMTTVISARHYRNSLLVAEAVALITFYAAANYFVVRELSNSMFDLKIKESETIRFGWLFWILTAVVPVAYIARGLKKKDVVLLRVGLLLMAAIVFTVRNYYHVMPVEILMVLGGIILVVIAWAVIKWLAEPKKGFTSAEGNTKYLLDNMNVEALIIAETFAHTGAAPEKKFGGGDFGGGGASADF